VTGGDKDNSVIPGWKPAVAVADTYWTAEVVIPFASLNAGPGTAWRMNVGRATRNNYMEASFWSACSTTHTPERFGKLEFK
jgi:hypothetical protein